MEGTKRPRRRRKQQRTSCKNTISSALYSIPAKVLRVASHCLPSALMSMTSIANILNLTHTRARARTPKVVEYKSGSTQCIHAHYELAFFSRRYLSHVSLCSSASEWGKGSERCSVVAFAVRTQIAVWCLFAPVCDNNRAEGIFCLPMQLEGKRCSAARPSQTSWKCGIMREMCSHDGCVCVQCVFGLCEFGFSKFT